jgi:hypothetical protein
MRAGLPHRRAHAQEPHGPAKGGPRSRFCLPVLRRRLSGHLPGQRPDPTGAVPARIVSVQGREGPANEGRLCVKGRFGMDYIHSPDRITKPLIRKPGVAKDLSLIDGRTDWQ